MTITAAFTDAAKQAALAALLPAGNTYKIALFTAAAVLGPTTTVYSATNEVSGTGYTAGGKALTGLTFSFSGGAAMATFDDPTWPSSTITGAAGAVIYDATDGNKVRAVLLFPTPVSSSNTTLTVAMPAVGPTTAVIRITN